MHRCMDIGMCMGVCGGACKWFFTCACERERACGQVHAHGNVGVCEREHESETCTVASVCACVHVQMPSQGGAWGPSPRVLRLGIWSGLCLPAWGGKQGLLFNSLGMEWGRGTWCSRHTECRDSILGAYPRPPRSTSGTSGTQGLPEGQCPPGQTQSFGLCRHNSHGLSLSRNKVLQLSRGLEVPGALNWVVTLCLLAC